MFSGMGVCVFFSSLKIQKQDICLSRITSLSEFTGLKSGTIVEEFFN